MTDYAFSVEKRAPCSTLDKQFNIEISPRDVFQSFSGNGSPAVDAGVAPLSDVRLALLFAFALIRLLATLRELHDHAHARYVHFFLSQAFSQCPFFWFCIKILFDVLSNRKLLELGVFDTKIFVSKQIYGKVVDGIFVRLRYA